MSTTKDQKICNNQSMSLVSTVSELYNLDQNLIEINATLILKILKDFFLKKSFKEFLFI